MYDELIWRILTYSDLFWIILNYSELVLGVLSLASNMHADIII